MSIKLQVDVAVEVFVNTVPLMSSADFITIDETIAYNEAGMDLNWNFITTAGTVSQTNITPTTAGDYDWTHVGNGMYKIEIPATGGVSINNDTEGVGWFSGICTGVLAWVSPQYEFVPANVANSLVNGSDYLQVDTLQAEGSDFTTYIDGRTLAAASYFDPAADTVANVTTVATLTGHTPQTGDSFARIGATGSGLTSLATQASVNTVDGIVDAILLDTGTDGVIVATNNDKTGYALSAAGIQAVWDALTPALTTVNSIGKLLVDNINATIGSRSSHAAADVWSVATRVLTAGANIVLAKGVGITGLNDLSAAQVNAECDTALVDYDAPTNAEMEARTLVAASYFDSATDTVAHVTLVDTTTTNTDMVAAAPTEAAIADAVWNETLADHLGAGSTGAALNAAGAAGDPWSTAIPGAYGVGTAGKIVGDNLDTAISSRSNHAAADIWSVATRLLTAGTNIVLVKGVGITGLNDLSAAQVNAEADTALADYDPPTNAEMEARTLAAASYFDPAADTVAHVTLVDTTTTNTDMRGTNGANTVVPPTVAQLNARTLLAAEYATVANQTAIEADTADIQTRLPAALISGRMSSDLEAINNSAAAAVRLALSAGTIVSGAAAAGTLSTTQMTTNLTETTNDHYNGRIIIWTSGVLKDQATDITDYDGATKMLTFTAVTEAPTAGDTFVIV